MDPVSEGEAALPKGPVDPVSESELVAGAVADNGKSLALTGSWGCSKVWAVSVAAKEPSPRLSLRSTDVVIRAISAEGVV